MFTFFRLQASVRYFTLFIKPSTLGLYSAPLKFIFHCCCHNITGCQDSYGTKTRWLQTWSLEKLYAKGVVWSAPQGRDTFSCLVRFRSSAIVSCRVCPPALWLLFVCFYISSGTTGYIKFICKPTSRLRGSQQTGCRCAGCVWYVRSFLCPRSDRK